MTARPHAPDREPTGPADPRAPRDPATPPPSIGRPMLGALRALLPREASGTPEERSATAPFTGEALPAMPVTSLEALGAVAADARAAQTEWAARPIRERARLIRRIGLAFAENLDVLCDLMQWETGKARIHAAIEVQGVVAVAEYYGRTAARHLAPRRAAGAVPGIVTTRVAYRPKGLIGVIAPWNYPLFLAVGDVLPALVAGNAVLSKADSQAPWTLFLARRLALDAGLPPALWPVVAGPGARLGPAIVEHVDHLAFTGSTATGRDIARRCADRLIGASLELGGKNAMIVCDDADLDAAATGAVQACFSNAGQMCIGIERLYVDGRVYDRFVELFTDRVRRLRLGADYSYEVDMGSLTSRGRLDDTVRHVEDAVRRGATVLAGGHPRPDVGPLFHDATVLADVTDDMLVYSEETFGPVVSVYRVAGDDDAVARANEGEYGLSASVWSADLARAAAIAARIVAGSVNVNDGYLSAIASVDAPMGGMRSSGVGRRHGRDGVVRYTEPQTVTTQRVPTAYPDRFRAATVRATTLALRARLAWPRRS